jgi:hypothetical protein
MWRKLLIAFSSLVFAFGILFVSILRTAAVKYDFYAPSGDSVMGDEVINIEYNLAFPGKVLPNSPLWPMKALRDKVWLFITTNKSRRAEIKLLFADKRLGAAKTLFESGNPEVGFSTLTKAEKYLSEASILEKESRLEGDNTTEFQRRLAYASLKHYQTINEIKEIAPQDAIPQIVEIEKLSQKVYLDAKNELQGKDLEYPENPFDWN